MVNLVFVTANGQRQEIEAETGKTVMSVALDAGIPQILADCGGSMACATCHVHIAPDWLDRVGPAQGDELVMLEMAIDPDETSRLSCQIKLDADLDGLVINLPVSQI